MASKLLRIAYTGYAIVLVLQLIGAARLCPNDPNCICGGTLAVELNCNIDGRTVKINVFPNTYINIKCENTSIDYSKLPKCANKDNAFKSVSFKDCPLPSTSFKEVLTNIGVTKTMALIFQNTKHLSGYFERKHFTGLQDLTKLLLSVNGITKLPDNLFTDINNLTWLNIRSNSINLSEELFKPLERLETLEISHNHMTNISSNLFSHLSFLRKLSLWQSNVTWFSKDFFTGVDVLEELDLSSNGLNELPQSIFKPLRKLKKLTLFSNKFSSLPRNLFKNNEELETVVILNNNVKLKEVPKYFFGNLPNMREIYFQRCGLEIIPYDVFANSPLITNISLAYNDIKTLPEAVFNDQINLLDLDLSHNKLDKLEPKIFSSLVRLESLNLCHNSLIQIYGSTFSSLLSLIYLNMENNKLETVTSSLFSNNKQRMSISLAYNQLTFEERQLLNNTWITKEISPFAHTYNLKLLNLSHNRFEKTFDDWWKNGHEALDISHNLFHNLYNPVNESDTMPLKLRYRDIMKKPLKEVWISDNPLECNCEYFQFLDFLESSAKIMIVDKNLLKCSFWSKYSCHWKLTIFIIFVATSLTLSLIIMLLYVVYHKQFNVMLKMKFSSFFQHHQDKFYGHAVRLRYAELDEEFVLKEILPELNHQKDIKILANPIQSSAARNQQISRKFPCDKANHVTLTIFSPNYLTSVYSHVNIKKIRGEMAKAKNTIYIFVDVGPENSIYAFLREQRDMRMTILWHEPDFWNKFLSMLSDRARKKMKNRNDRIVAKMFNTAKDSTSTSTPFTRLSDWPNFYTIDSLTHSQV